MKSMLDILKVVDKVEKPVPLNEAASLSINASGDNSADVADMVGKIFGLSQKPVTPDMMPKTEPMPMVKAIQSVGDYADQAAKAYVDEVGEELSGGYDDTGTELDHEVADEPGDVDDVTMKTAGGLNRPHHQFRKEYPGDNPMAESLLQKMMEEWKQVKESTLSELSPELARRAGTKSIYRGNDSAEIGDKDRARKEFARGDKFYDYARKKETKKKPLSELSPDTLKNYTKKALNPSSSKSISNLASRGGFELGKSPDDDYSAGEKYDKKATKRSHYVQKAVDKLTK